MRNERHVHLLASLLIAMTAMLAYPPFSRNCSAADVQLHLTTYSSNTFELTMVASTGDNAGIAGYNVPILNAGNVTHNVISQRHVDLPEFIINGFVLNDASDSVLFGSMNCQFCHIWGIGNPEFLVPPPPEHLVNHGMPPIGEPFGPVLLATGHGNWQTVNIGAAGFGVWERVNFLGVELAGVTVVVERIAIPEPPAWSLLLTSIVLELMIRRSSLTRWIQAVAP